MNKRKLTELRDQISQFPSRLKECKDFEIEQLISLCEKHRESLEKSHTWMSMGNESMKDIDPSSYNEHFANRDWKNLDSQGGYAYNGLLLLEDSLRKELDCRQTQDLNQNHSGESVESGFTSHIEKSYRTKIAQIASSLTDKSPDTIGALIVAMENSPCFIGPWPCGTTKEKFSLRAIEYFNMKCKSRQLTNKIEQNRKNPSGKVRFFDEKIKS